jgi:hypothetical protein
VTITESSGTRQVPYHLTRPEIVFERIWASPVDDTLYSLFD